MMVVVMMMVVMMVAWESETKSFTTLPDEQCLSLKLHIYPHFIFHTTGVDTLKSSKTVERKELIRKQVYYKSATLTLNSPQLCSLHHQSVRISHCRNIFLTNHIIVTVGTVKSGGLLLWSGHNLSTAKDYGAVH